MRKGYTFDDVLLVPKYSDVLPQEVQLSTQLTENFYLNIPILSAAMSDVTESGLAIALARLGGLGIIHRLLSPEQQAYQVDRVKKSESGMITDPITLSCDATIAQAEKLMSEYHISGIPITRGTKLVGLLTNRDIQFEKNLHKKVHENMTTVDNLIVAKNGITMEEAQERLYKYRKEKLPIVDDNFNLLGLITIKDIEKKLQYPDACKDDYGRLCVGASVGVVDLDVEERIEKLVKTFVDIIVVDTAHGHSKNVLTMINKIKNRYPDLPVIGGNVATGAGAKALVDAGADAVKVGVGPGSICTTRIVAGSGVPQITAIMDVSDAVDVPVIADGGIRTSGDIVKAQAAGANAVMIGSMFAGTDEAPGEETILHGRKYKVYRGMGSLDILEKGLCNDRYAEDPETKKKIVPEGVEGKVPYKGSLAGIVHQLIGGMRQGFGYIGAKDIETLQRRAEFIEITEAGFKESHVHDVLITRESPNYQKNE
jgi:IMP dehydrogenase